MPLSESDETSRDKLFELRKQQVCSECGGMLNVFQDDNKDSPNFGKAFLACNDWQRTHHEGISKEARIFTENIESRRQEMEKEIGIKRTKTLEKYSYGALATETEAMEVLETIWPKAPLIEKKKAAMLCVSYQLNPLMRHVFLLAFNEGKTNEKWAIVLGIQANRIIAHRAGNFSYVDNTPRVMTKPEQEIIFGETFEDRIWAITKLKDNQGNEAVGYGCYMKSETPYGSEKGNTKANMAFIRSERQAMDRLFAGKMPEQQFEVADERFLDTDTSGVVEGEVVEKAPKTLEPVAPESQTTHAKEKSSVVAPKEAGKTVEFDPSPVKNFGELWTRCKNYGISKVEGLASLKVKSQADIADLDDAWRAIFKDRFPEVKI